MASAYEKLVAAAKKRAAASKRRGLAITGRGTKPARAAKPKKKG